MSTVWRTENDEWSVEKISSNLHSLFSDLSETPGLDAQVLLAEITGQNRAWLLAHPEAALSPQQQNQLREAVSRLQAGDPLPYVLGHWEFYGLDFTITPDTLIPRPETELMIEQALAWLKKHPGRRQAADIGTGSGCIPVSLAVNMPDLQITAVDISPAALEIARTNAQKHRVAPQIIFTQADLWPANLPPCHLICANLPYIPTPTLKQLKIYEREPTLALDGGPDGLGLIRRLLPQAARNLASEGLLLLEIEASQGPAVLTLAREYFPAAKIQLLTDLARHDRLISIETFTR